MDGTSKYINLLTGPGGNGMPPGGAVGDILRWDGSYWNPVQLDDLVAAAMAPAVYVVGVNGEIPNLVANGRKLVHVTVRNNSGLDVVVDLGYSNGGTDLLDSQEISAGSWVDIPVNKHLSFTAPASLWLNADTISAGAFTLIIETL